MDTSSQVQLLLDASHDDDATAAAVDRIGLLAVTDLVTDEILFRADLDDLAGADDTATVVVTLTHRGDEIATPISVGPDGVVVGEEKPGGLPPVTVVQDAAETVRALFGPRARVSAATREIRWPGPDVVVLGRRAEGPLPRVFAAAVQRVIAVLDRREPADLAELAVRYGSDKWGPMHQYTRHYQRHLEPWRDRRLTVLEIGVGGYDDPAAGGGSLRMWRRYFPRALVYGLDIADKSALDQPRIRTVRADQSDPVSLRAVAERFGPFDIVIDDGSHISSHVLTSFEALFPHVRPDGLYVIEDLHGSFWPMLFAGSEDDLSDPAYTLGFLKTLVDGLHHEEFLSPQTRRPRPTDTAISEMHFYHNLCVLQKGPNREGSPVAELLRAATPEQLADHFGH
ncbi:MAG: class I SAM-dependent methyltransferase [Actinomadura rubrobrunea]|nr:class I SAM-dependent methyltransferase [Actinomadura rubrobrunea]